MSDVSITVNVSSGIALARFVEALAFGGREGHIIAGAGMNACGLILERCPQSDG